MTYGTGTSGVPSFKEEGKEDMEGRAASWEKMEAKAQ